MGGATSGKFTVKSCGKAHAWCSVCRPDQAAAQRKAKPAPKVYALPCRNCGRCDACLGISAQEGMKVCRQCGETKPLSAFAKRTDAGTYRNQCMKCRNGGIQWTRCQGCGKKFGRWSDGRKLCKECSPKGTFDCIYCGTPFVRSLDSRRYCTPECGAAALKEQRDVKRRAQRLEGLRHYSGTPEPLCACCGESTLAFLAIDHVNGGGRQQYKELGGGGFWSWLRKNNYPEGFQVLCHNCNMGRQINGGTCPHKVGT